MAPEVRRKLAPKIPPATAGAFKHEPTMEEAEYQHILGVMENMAHVLERIPKAFYNLDEEGLRTHFLVQLNGHYEGQATGETLTSTVRPIFSCDRVIGISLLLSANFGVVQRS